MSTTTYVLTAVVRASLGSHVGKPSDGQVVFPQVPKFSPTFDERSAQYK